MFVVRLRNRLPESTTIHWHGLHLPFYFTVDLEPGRYALVSEAPDVRRMAQEITVD